MAQAAPVRRAFLRFHLEADAKPCVGDPFTGAAGSPGSLLLGYNVKFLTQRWQQQACSRVEFLASRANLVPFGRGNRSDRCEDVVGRGSLESREAADQVSWPSQWTEVEMRWTKHRSAISKEKMTDVQIPAGKESPAACLRGPCQLCPLNIVISGLGEDLEGALLMLWRAQG